MFWGCDGTNTQMLLFRERVAHDMVGAGDNQCLPKPAEVVPSYLNQAE